MSSITIGKSNRVILIGMIIIYIVAILLDALFETPFNVMLGLSYFVSAILHPGGLFGYLIFYATALLQVCILLSALFFKKWVIGVALLLFVSNILMGLLILY
jgi:hypothetical protein